MECPENTWVDESDPYTCQTCDDVNMVQFILMYILINIYIYIYIYNG